MAAPNPLTPSIHVLLFARYAELLGADRFELPVGGQTTVAEVVARIRALPGGGSLPPGALVAVNLRQAAPTAPVLPGDEVAFLPPLAGG